MDVIDESGYKQVTVEDALEQSSSTKKISRNEALEALETVGKITRVERLQYCYEKDLLEVSRCNAITVRFKQTTQKFHRIFRLPLFYKGYKHFWTSQI